MTQVSEKALKRKANKNVILALSSTLVWFVALVAFVLLSSFDFLEKYSCLLFFYAIPANAIVLLSLRSAWHDFRWNKALTKFRTLIRVKKLYTDKVKNRRQSGF